jgi:hypothetical protein
MYRVRIKTSPDGGTHKGTGQQEEYGLVRNLSAMQNAPQTVGVNNKMGAIPRDQANIEVEGGESVIGDVNQDGTMELMHFVGKRHSEGGVPVNIPEGSFIFSDTKSLTIKDREVVEKIFNLPFRKQGYTPGEISKKYEINTYVEVLKDENADPLAKRSAAEMLKKNKQKLGILAFIQESMKGFPDGIPAIAEEVLSTMGIDPNQMAQQFAPPQPEQGMEMQQGMMPPMEGQGIPMSEDEDAMAGMLPEGPAVAPDQIPEQMMGRFGGTMLPRFEEGGFWDDMMSMVSSSMSTSNKSGCKSGYVWNPHVKECVTPNFANVKDIFRIPEHAFQSNAQEWTYAPEPAPKKKETAADKKAQNLFDKNFKVSGKPTAFEQAREAQARAIEEQRKKSGYYEKAEQLKPIIKKVMEGTATSEEEALASDINRFLTGINTDGTYTAERLAEEQAIYDIDKKYGTLSNEQIAKKKREEDAAKAKAEAEKAAAKAKADAEDRAKNPYKYNIPGFGSKSDLDEYMAAGAEQYTAGETFYNALLSGDPNTMISAANDIKDLDVSWSWGWLPYTDQDKIDDMYTILHEEALKKLNQKQKEIITKDYTPSTVENKLKDLIANLESQRDDATDVKTKLSFARTIEKYKDYKKILFDNKGYEGWYNSVQKSHVTPNSPGVFGFLDYDLGSPIQDIKYPGYGNNDGDSQTLMNFVEEITKQHDIIKKTNVATVSPLAFKGQTRSGGSGRGDTLSWGEESDSFEVFNTEGKVKEVASRLYKNDNRPNVAKNYKPEYKSQKYPLSVFRVGKNEDTGEAIWIEYTDEGAEVPVSDANVVKELNAAASKAENKPYAIKPTEGLGGGTAVENLQQELKIDPTIKSETPATKQQGSTTTPRKSVVAPIKKDAPKFESGITDDDFKKFEKFQEGGVVGQIKTIRGQQFRYGGMIDEQGRLRYSRGGSVLPKYNNAGTVTGPGDPPKEERVASNETVGNPPKTVNVYKQVFTDPNGGAPTTIMIFRDASDETKIVARRNSETGQSYKPNETITRASSTWVTKDNLNKEEEELIAKHWNNKPELYLNYINSKNQMYLNKDFRTKMFDTYTQGLKDEYVIPGKGKMRKADMYTGANNETTRTSLQTTYGADLQGLSEEQMLQALFDQEERNRRLEAYGYGDVKGEQNVYSSGTGKHDNINARAYNMVTNTYKNELGDLDFSKGYRGQAAYLAYQRSLLDNTQFQDYAEQLQTGVNDETAFGIKGQVSGIDNYNTNTTLEQKLGWKPKPPGPPPPKPGMKQAYYCVEYTDGTKMVQTVDYKEDETPAKPTGDKIKNATQYDTLELANTNCETPPPPPGTPPKEIPQPDTWFTPDVINLATGIRQRVPHPNAVLRQMPQIYSGYDLNNPITQIAGATGLMRQQQDLAMNTMDPTTAFAAMAGQGYDALAKGIAGVEEKNVDTVNNYLGRIGQLQYNYDAANMQGQRQFDVDTEVGKEEFARDLNKVDAQNAMLYGTGWGNVQKDNALRVAYPNAWHANRITPDFAWSGVGKDPLGPDTSVTPGGSSGQTDCSGEYARAYNSVKNDATMTDEAKRKYAESMMQSCISQNNYRVNQTNKTPQQNYSGNLISNVKWSQFGGTYTAPGAYDYEFGGAYFDDF